MTRSTIENAGTPARAGELVPISVGLSVAAIEFAVCSVILLALVVPGVVSPATAATWAAVVLVPLSATIAFLGIRVGLVARRASRGGAGASRAELSRAA